MAEKTIEEATILEVKAALWEIGQRRKMLAQEEETLMNALNEKIQAEQDKVAAIEREKTQEELNKLGDDIQGLTGETDAVTD